MREGRFSGPSLCSSFFNFRFGVPETGSTGGFFQKRRVVRLIDKVFDKEFNLRRVEEFRSLIEHRGRATRLRCPTLLCQPVRAGVL
jgi:hypothetical protein